MSALFGLITLPSLDGLRLVEEGIKGGENIANRRGYRKHNKELNF